MATSKVNIWNLALASLGSTALVLSEDEPSKEARLCRLYWDVILQATLEGTDWPFARRRATLALIEESPSAEWGYRYAVPTDCASARYIQPAGRVGVLPRSALIPFVIEGSSDGKNPTLVTDLAEAVLVYTTNKQGAGTYPAVFTRLLAALLAADLALPLTTNASIAKEKREAALSALLEARSAKFSEQSFDRTETPSEIELARR